MISSVQAFAATAMGESEQQNKASEDTGSDPLSLEVIGALICSKRSAMNLSQEELAALSGIHRSYISEIERGQRNFTIKVLARIAECLNLSMSQLIEQAIKGPSDER